MYLIAGAQKDCAMKWRLTPTNWESKILEILYGYMMLQARWEREWWGASLPRGCPGKSWLSPHSTSARYSSWRICRNSHTKHSSKSSFGRRYGLRKRNLVWTSWLHTDRIERSPDGQEIIKQGCHVARLYVPIAYLDTSLKIVGVWQ